MDVRVGTSGFSYKEWKGDFYPERLPATRFLDFYATKFRAVEINQTFRTTPGPEALARWRAQAPEPFVFAVKAPEAITHRRRLRDAGVLVQEFVDAVAPLGPQLGPILFQLPPNFAKDLDRLRAFLEVLPSARRVAFEFRHRTWFSDDVHDALRAHGAALCVAEDDELATPPVWTADFTYLRLRRTTYDDDALRVWATRLRASGCAEGFVFFRHEETGTGPRFARRLVEMLG